MLSDWVGARRAAPAAQLGGVRRAGPRRVRVRARVPAARDVTGRRAAARRQGRQGRLRVEHSAARTQAASGGTLLSERFQSELNPTNLFTKTSISP